MRIAVIGAGVVGATTADALLQRGHEVSLFEQAVAGATGASAANAGQLSYSYCDAMASPALFKQIPRILAGRDPGMRIKPLPNTLFLRWSLSLLREGLAFQKNSGELLKLALESAELMRHYHETLGDLYCHRVAGKLVLLPSTPDRRVRDSVASKQRAGLKLDIIDRAEAERLEPALCEWQGTFSHALYAPGDEVGDAALFTRGLLERLAKQGVKIYYNTQLDSLQKSGSRIQLRGPELDSAFDTAVLCTARVPLSFSRSLGVQTPVYPVAGYSLTMPATTNSPKVSVTAISEKLVFSQLGARLRIAGCADINLSSEQAQQRSLELLQRAQRLAPTFGAFGDCATPWVGYRPMTPSSVPMISETKIPNVYVNLGHGMLGWTLAAGSAKRLAQCISPARSHSTVPAREGSISSHGVS